jgi:hypothetical protein
MSAGWSATQTSSAVHQQQDKPSSSAGEQQWQAWLDVLGIVYSQFHLSNDS